MTSKYPASCQADSGQQPRGRHCERKSLCFIFKAEVECDDIQGKTAGRNALSLRKENRKVSVQLVSFCHNDKLLQTWSKDSPNDYVELEHVHLCVI